MTDNDIAGFIEPILRFCLSRLQSRAEAEDLAGEIILAALIGSRKYKIDSPEAWIWRIARNRYARHLSRRRITLELSEDFEPASESDPLGELIKREEHEQVFRALHTLAADYRELTIAHHLRGESLESLARHYGLPLTTIKWRLNISRRRIKERMDNMEKIYSRINWDSTSCNGCFDPDHYLHSQIARAICLAAYEHPVSIEQISLATGIPVLYIEDSLPELIYGDAIVRENERYTTDFIILRLADKHRLESLLKPYIMRLSDNFEALLDEKNLALLPHFFGKEYEMKRLAPIAVSLSLRHAYSEAMHICKLEQGEFPLRHDGGYGWYVVEECEDSTEQISRFASGCNRAEGDGFVIDYLWTKSHFEPSLYHGAYGTKKLASLIKPTADGCVPPDATDDESLAGFIESGLIERGDALKFAFPIFTKASFDAFKSAFTCDESREIVAEILPKLRTAVASAVPERLEPQVNQLIGCIAGRLVGMVDEELERRGLLECTNTSGILAVI